MAPTTSVVLGGLYPRQGILNLQQQSAAAQINQVFDAFRDDYSQARATYFTSIQNQPNPSPATTNAFAVYTTQRVSLIAQQVLSVFAHTRHRPGQLHRSSQLVATKIIGTQGQIGPGSLAASLLQSIPQPGTSSPTSSLYSLGQDNAIEAARVAMLNGV